MKPKPVTGTHTYPYTHHLSTSTELWTAATLPASDLRRYREFHRSELREFVNSLDLAVALARMSDQVAVFALGGLAPLHYVLERLGAYREKASEYVGFQRKFHVFGGLNWPGFQDENQKCFLDWLTALPRGCQLLLFDTGRDGSAAGQLYNFIEKHSGAIPVPITIQILVVGEVDRSRPKTDRESIEFNSSAGTLVLSKDVIRVPDTATEDAIYLAGYMKAKDVLGLQAVNIEGTFKIVLEDGQTAEVASGTTGQAFIDILAHKLDLLSVLPM